LLACCLAAVSSNSPTKIMNEKQALKTDFSSMMTIQAFKNKSNKTSERFSVQVLVENSIINPLVYNS
jgi:hypothetical protein